MADFVDIVSLEVPAEAEAGSLVTVSISLRNKQDRPYEVRCGIAPQEGSQLSPGVGFTPSTVVIQPGSTATTQARFTMPEDWVEVRAYAWYRGADGEFHVDDEAVKAIALATVPVHEDPEVPQPEESSIFDDILKWIANAIASIVKSITSWWDETVFPWFNKIWTWLVEQWGNISEWFSRTWDWITEKVGEVWEWITTEVGKVWEWITTTAAEWGARIWTWLQEGWGKVWGWLSEQWANISGWFQNLWTSMCSFFADLWLKIEEGWDWLIEWMKEHIVNPMDEWWDEFLERLFNFGAWVGDLLDAIWGWLMEDVPGSSPRLNLVVWNIWQAFLGLFWAPKEVLEAPWWEQFFYAGEDLLRFVGEVFNSVAEIFLEAVESFVDGLGPTNPDIAGDASRSLTSVAMTALAGLAGMTIASSWLKPLGGAGMGQIAAMIYDMTNYKVITGAAIAALTVAAIKTPMTYHYNELFRPWMLRQADFMELMARGAFRWPEKLRVPELSETVAALPHGGGIEYERRMIGYYGFPDMYYGFFKELSFAPLRYFPLAGIARTGYYDKDWFIEALSRSGYSPTAKDALLIMFEEMVLTSRQGPALYQLRRLSREGFSTMEEIKHHLDVVAKIENLTDCRLYAMELEQEFARKEAAFDIIMGAFSKGIVRESEARSGIASLGVPGDQIELHFLREKLGLARRISIPAEAAAPAVVGVEEG